MCFSWFAVMACATTIIWSDVNEAWTENGNDTNIFVALDPSSSVIDSCACVWCLGLQQHLTFGNSSKFNTITLILVHFVFLRSTHTHREREGNFTATFTSRHIMISFETNMSKSIGRKILKNPFSILHAFQKAINLQHEITSEKEREITVILEMVFDATTQFTFLCEFHFVFC